MARSASRRTADGTAREFPTIRRAALIVALSAGTISSRDSAEAHYRDVTDFLIGRDQDALRPVERWLASLPEEDLQTICDGDREGQLRLLLGAPSYVDDLLEALFERA